MSWTRKIGHPNEVLEKGQQVTLPGAQRRPGAQADRPGPQAARARTRGRPTSPSRYQPGDVVKGKVTKLTNFGVFVELEPGLEGLLHISELADHKVESPEEVVKVGDEIEVKILRVDRGERKIGLSRKKAQWTKPTARARKARPPAATPAERRQAKETKELKGGLGGGGPLFSMGGPRPRTARAALPPPRAGAAPICVALGVENVPLDVVHRDRVGGEKQGVVVPEPLGILAEGPPSQTPRECVHDVQDALRADDGMADDRRDERDHGDAVGAGVRAEDVVDQAMAHVLEGAGDAGGVVVLQAGQADDLVEPPGDDLAEV